MDSLIWPEDDGKGHKPDLIVDDGSYFTLLVHEGEKADYLFLKDGTFPDPSSTDNDDFNIVQTIIKCQLKGGETDRWKKIVNTCMGVSENTFKGVHHM